jgi:hypothetical protein
MSKKVRLNKSLFTKGDYKLEFEIIGNSEELFSYVTIN